MNRLTRLHLRPSGSALALAAAFLAVTLLATSVLAQDDEEEKKYGWFFSADLAWVMTSGNAEANTLGFGGTVRRVWESSVLKIDAGGMQTESSIKTRTAVGTSVDDFVVEETKVTEKTAEIFFAGGRYDYNISKRFFTFGGAHWLRNRFSGIESRFLIAGGAGNTWVDREDMKFTTDYGVTYTFEEDVVENPFLKTNFPGIRLGYDFLWKMTKTTEFISDFIMDWNLDNTEDVRIAFKNELPVSISSHLKLKPAVTLLWRNQPALTEVDLYDNTGTPTGDKVFVPLEDLDVLTTVALVLEW
jgi:putative salt-induced outer membrane protein YdiY